MTYYMYYTDTLIYIFNTYLLKTNYGYKCKGHFAEENICDHVVIQQYKLTNFGLNATKKNLLMYVSGMRE